MFIGMAETPTLVSSAKVSIQVGGVRSSYMALQMYHLPTNGASSVNSTQYDYFSYVQDLAAARTLSNPMFEQYYSAVMNNAGGSLTAEIALHQIRAYLTQTAGTLTTTNFRFQSFQLDGTEVWAVHKSGAHQNRFNGSALVVMGLGGAPDSIAIPFPYALPDTKYTVELTGGWAAYVVTDKLKAIVGRGYVYVKAVVDFSSKTTTAVVGYVEYQAIDLATSASWAGAQWDNYVVMTGLAGIMAHYAGGVAIVFTDADLGSVDWAIRRYF